MRQSLTLVFRGQLHAVRFGVRVLVALSFLLANTVFAASDAPAYLRFRVRNGDQVGRVLYKLGIGPLWGKGRFVERTLSLNNMTADYGRTERDLRPGQWIVLPVAQLSTSQYYTVSQDGVVTILNDAALEAHFDAQRRSVASVAVIEEQPFVSPPISQAASSSLPQETLEPQVVTRPDAKEQTPKVVSLEPEKQVTQPSQSSKRSEPLESSLSYKPIFWVQTRAAFAAWKSQNKSTEFLADVASDVMPALALGIEQRWNADWVTGVNFCAQKATVLEPHNTEMHLSGNNQVLYGIEGYAEFGFFDMWTLRGGVGYAQDLFARTVDATTVSLDRVPRHYVRMQAKRDLIRELPFGVGVGLEGTYFSTGTAGTGGAKAKSGYEYGALGYAYHQLTDRMGIHSHFVYRLQEQDATHASRKKDTIEMGLGLWWQLGK